MRAGRAEIVVETMRVRVPEATAEQPNDLVALQYRDRVHHGRRTQESNWPARWSGGSRGWGWRWGDKVKARGRCW